MKSNEPRAEVTDEGYYWDGRSSVKFVERYFWTRGSSNPDPKQKESLAVLIVAELCNAC